MAQQGKAPSAKPADQSAVLGIHAAEEEKRLHQVVL